MIIHLVSSPREVLFRGPKPTHLCFLYENPHTHNPYGGGPPLHPKPKPQIQDQLKILEKSFQPSPLTIGAPLEGGGIETPGGHGGGVYFYTSQNM